jgi:hypothetical protein
MMIRTELSAAELPVTQLISFHKTAALRMHHQLSNTSCACCYCCCLAGSVRGTALAVQSGCGALAGTTSAPVPAECHRKHDRAGERQPLHNAAAAAAQAVLQQVAIHQQLHSALEGLQQHTHMY